MICDYGRHGRGVLVGGLLLVAAETLSGDSVLLMVGAGALSAAGGGPQPSFGPPTAVPPDPDRPDQR